jgi:acyl carrier protein
MSTDDVYQSLIRYLGEFFESDLSHVQREARIVNAIPGLDSLRLQEVLIYLEDRFHVQFDEAVLDHIETVQSFVNHIESLQRQQRPAGAS